MNLILLFVIAAVMSCIASAAAYKILFFPFGNRSHLIEFHGLGRVLLNRGHEVHIYLSKIDTPPVEVAAAGYKFVHPNTDDTFMPIMFKEDDMINRIDKSFLQQIVEARDERDKFTAALKNMARTMMNDQPTLEYMKLQKYDFALVDSAFFLYFVFLVPHKLGIPFGGLTTMHDPLANRVPFIPSAFPDVALSTSFGVEPGLLGSSIAHRIKNFFATMVHLSYMHGWTDEAFASENVTYSEIVSKISLHLVDQHFLLTDPMPTTPNYHMVGGLVTRPAQAIVEEKLLNFIESTNHPVIVCSFGSYMSTLTPTIVNKLLNAFRQVPQYRVVMRLTARNITDVPDNLLILDWLPQNDLLGHNKTSLLISHSGNNGQNEAVFHGVPLVAFYIFGDQGYNADRIVRRGYGVKLNLLAFSDSDLVAAINQVMQNESYTRKVKRASAIFREHHSADIAADLIEHVIRFGSDHLRTDESFAMPFYQFAMLDIIFVVYTLVLILVILVFVLIRCTYRICCKTLCIFVSL